MDTTTIEGPGGRLQLLYSLPSPSATATTTTKPPILFVHGTMCSARDYAFFLPYLASRGFPAYALSVRGHGGSQEQSFLVKMLFTTADSWAQDIAAALSYVAARHPDADRPPVLGGHSLGGGRVASRA
ncbi:Alpha/Beta hydrolase protein [Microdochium bolleyi]|uniref:Alpha/Beta hydrolase protein n=1 Tax=Microdochium bolleyi TaxID=196109 RepID=A0A136IKI2_9PEZI|nr:Alpha/Beta hydrolase protein [Microdochium bolleyi]